MGKLTLTFLLSLLFSLVKGQDGSPLLIHFGEKWDVENQNFVICQDSDRVMLFANRKGIIAFDGEEWTPIRLQTTPYAMGTNPYDKKIYVGGENNYGTVQKDYKGIYRYQSLSDDSAGIGMITRIIFSDSLIVFCSDLSVSCHRLEDLSLVRRFYAHESPFTGTFLKGKDTFINVRGKGLHRVDADTLFPIVTGYITEKTEILFSLPYDRERVLLGFSNGRLSLFDGIKYYSYAVRDEGYIAGNVLSEGISIGDSLYAFSTLGGGAVVIERKSGNVRFIINNQNGLPDDEIFAIGNDNAGGLWLSHPFGLTRADLMLPVKNHGIYPGLRGNLSTSLRYNDELYVATSEGIFYLAHEMKYTEVEVLRKNKPEGIPEITPEPVLETETPLVPMVQKESSRKGILNRIFGRKSETAPQPGVTTAPAARVIPATPSSSGGAVTIREVPAAMYRTEKIRQLKSIDYLFRKIDGVNVKCRQLVPTANGILAATNRGLYVIRDHKAATLVPERYINHISWRPWEGRYSVAAGDGYFLAGWENNKWNIFTPDKSFTEPLYSILRDKEGMLWLGGDNKAYRAEEDNLTGKVSYKSYTIRNSFSQRYILNEINDSVFLFSETSVNVFDKNADSFVACYPEGSSETSEFRYPVSNIPLIVAGNTFIYPEGESRLRQKDLSILKLFDNIISIYCEEDKIWIVDGNNQLFEIDRRLASSMKHETDLLVKKIRNEKGTVFGLTDVIFARGDNVINFDIVVPAYLNKNLTEYQYYIDKVMDDWSQWSTKTSYSMGIPKAGSYELRIRARDLWGQVGEPVVVNFTIKAPFTQTSIFFVLVILAGLLLIFALVGFREKQLQEKNRILEEKVRERTAEIEAQKEEITASIEYASRIQMAMLPVSCVFTECFDDYFIIFKPRDIVSGDFYWVGEDGENIYFTVADCTGHGVPGAFMSTLGISILNEIITHHSNLKASTFLNILRDQIKMLLHQTGKEGEAADGMDISLCVLRKNRKMLQFSGAFNPLYVHTGGELKEFRADRMPIGIHYGDEASFTNHEINVSPGDVIYLLTDGLTDQFGGPEGSKFKKAQLKQLLSTIHHRPLSEQKKLIELEFLKWKGSNEQVDDVTIIGLRV